MIPEIFLTCALSLPMAFAMHDEEPQKPMTTIVELAREAFAKYPRTHDRLGVEAASRAIDWHIRGKVLLIGGDPYHIHTLRLYGLNAFHAYTEDYPGITPRSAVMDLGAMAFTDEIFQMVFFHHINMDAGRNMEALVDATMLVAEKGFFMFDEERFPHWMDYLIAQGWMKRWTDYNYQVSGWRRPQRLQKPAWGHNKKLIQFPVQMPRWKMKGGGVNHAEQRALQTSA